jgi:2-polyprenyl-6-methoxyphenol hydroxylase-like FAD-dependent oxidoreductase
VRWLCQIVHAEKNNDRSLKNALCILDRLGVYSRIQDKAFHFDLLCFRSPDDQPLDSYEFGSPAKYGYSGLRIYHSILIDELLALVQTHRIPIHYHKKFSRVVSESSAGVTWRFGDGTSQSASLLAGADGIHSRVRGYIHPDIQPVFTNAVGVTAAVPTSHLIIPPQYSLPVTIMNPTHGAFVIAPQQPDGSEVLIGKQKRAADLDRDGWAALLNDKKWCIEFLRDGAEDSPRLCARL